MPTVQTSPDVQTSPTSQTSPTVNTSRTVNTSINAIIGEPAQPPHPQGWGALQSSKPAALGWTAMRVWLGVMWIQAGAAKLWGAESSAFLHHNGAGVAGVAAH